MVEFHFINDRIWGSSLVDEVFVKKFLLSISFGALFPVILFGQECANVDNDLDRLACYDSESGRTPTVETIESTSNWVVRTEISDMTDETSVYMTVSSDEPISCGYLGGAQPARLILRCSENTTAIIISTSCHLTSGLSSYGDVTYRLDDLPARTKGFVESTNNKSLGLWGGGSSIPFIKEMLGKSQILTRFTPYSENPVTANFNISGIDEDIVPLREACGW